MFTAKHIAKAIKRTLKQVKRWRVQFLGHDEKTGRWSGKERKDALDEAFKVSLGGSLITNWKFTAEEAKKVVNEVSAWLEKKDFLPSKHFLIEERFGTVYLDYTKLTLPPLELAIGRDAQGVFFYHVAERLAVDYPPDPENHNKPLRRTTYRDHTFGGGEAPHVAVGKDYVHMELKGFIEDLAKGLCYAVNEEKNRN